MDEVATSPSDRDQMAAPRGPLRRLRTPVFACLGACAAGLAFPGADGGASPQPDLPPNVLVVMTDDQTLEQTRVLRRVRAQIGERGASFANSFVNFPLCCPSRATFLTGQYASNHRVLDNGGRLGGFDRLRSDNILPLWLQEAGYYTGQVGKYLNEYGRRDPTLVPPGYDEWVATLAGSTDDVYDYTLNENGTLVSYGTDARDYKQDVITARAVDFLARRAPARRPFYLFVGYTAPHLAGPSPDPHSPEHCSERAAKPAPRHAHRFDAEPLPRPRSYNEPDVGDKPADIRSRTPIGPKEEAEITAAYRCALESLLSVDEGVGGLLQVLRRTDELRNTLVIYTSDNGFFYGEHRIRRGKKRLYEEASRVPLMIRGPGIEPGTVVEEPVINADLAATIAEAAGAEPGLRMDGMSLWPLIEEPSRWLGRELLIQSDRYRAIRTRRYIYADYEEGAREMYDLDSDQFQLQSVHGDPRYRRERRQLVSRLRGLRRCRAARCRRLPELGLELAFRGGGDPCERGRVKARINRHGEAIDQVSFSIGSRPGGIDRRAPFKRRLRLNASGGSIEALADFIDGRRLSLSEELPECE